MLGGDDMKWKAVAEQFPHNVEAVVRAGRSLLFATSIVFM